MHFWVEAWFDRVPGVSGVLIALNVRRLRRWVIAERRREQRYPRALTRHEARVHSQNGEDGIIEEIFTRLGAGGRTFVEFGASDGAENCTRNLVEHHGWSGVWFEGDAPTAERARRVVGHLPVRIVERYLDRENIGEEFASAGVDPVPDLMVIDVDGNDYWLWEEVGRRFRPRVVVVEYNATFPPGIRWVMPYDPKHRWDHSYYYGASLDALAELGSRLDYRLVGCDSNGVNAFFVRNDLGVGAFAPSGIDTTEHYVAPKQHALTFGHPKRLRPTPSMHALADVDARRLGLRLLSDRCEPMSVGAYGYIDVEVRNDSARVVSSGRPHPVHVSYHWLDSDGRVVLYDGWRTPLPAPLGPARQRRLPIVVQAPPEPGRRTLRVTLVQEDLRWFDEPPLELHADVECDVTPR
jgi:hypothetical protein